MSGAGDLSLGGKAAERLVQQGLEDETLPMLSCFRDLSVTATWCRERLPAIAGLVPGSLRAVRVLRYRPARRCTLRLDFSEGTVRRLYVKLFRPGRSRRVVRRMNALPATAPAGLHWPFTLSHLEREGVLVMGEVPGRSLDGVMVESDDAALMAGQVGAGIAQFHALADLGTRDPEEIPAWTIGDETGTLSRCLPRLLGLGAGSPRSVQGVLDRARQFLESASYSASVLLHRDLHPQQILVGESVGFVDLDNLAIGPPEIDLGNLIAHCDLLALHPGRGLNALEIWRGSLIAAYMVRRPLNLAAVHAVRATSLVRLASVYAWASHLPSLASRLLAQAERILVQEVAA